ncbi:hypothetical protein [Phenylobacterium sp.]|uniref:calcium-binding protein n=1 Tax=Phenylobacterium sp. TaxID=1871053 RepID=UPI002F9286E5
MTAYVFETITPDEAMTIRPEDTLEFRSAPASAIGVTYNSSTGLLQIVTITITAGGRSVTFNTTVAEVSQRGGIVAADGSKLLIGGGADDRLTGGQGADGLYGGYGNDSLDGDLGDDLIQGNAGDDLLTGGFGANVLYGGKGNDTLFASDTGETRGAFAHGNQGDDEVFGGGGGDTLLGGQGDDLVGGLGGNDYISGDLGNDELHGGAGDDTLVGGAGDDVIQTGGGADLVLAGDGNDRIAVFYSGGATVDAGEGRDTITSVSPGRDVLKGGEGADVFEFVPTTRPTEGQDDMILDWSSEDRFAFGQVSIYSIQPRQYSEFTAGSYREALSTANEHIMFTGAQYVAAQVGSDVVVFADINGEAADGADIAIVLVGRTLTDISLANF